VPTESAVADTAGDFHKRWYLGLGLGSSYLDPDESEIPFKLEKRTDFAWGGYLGYDVGSRLSVELGFNDLGRAELVSDHYVEYQQRSLSVLAYGFNRKAQREKREGLSGFARLGISQMVNHSDIDFERQNNISLLIGVGFEYGFLSNLAVRGELTSYDVDSNYAGLSLLYRIGHGHHDAELKKAPEPVEVAEPVTPVAKQRFYFARLVKEFVVYFDSRQFDFDAADDKVLQEVTEYLSDDPEIRLILTGFADTRGGKSDNQVLADQRVSAVLDYLIDQGIDRDRIKINAHGETAQFGTMATSRGRQENRRVQISVLIDE